MSFSSQDYTQDYKKNLKIFERLIRIAVTISDASGGINTTHITIEATKIYTRLTLSSLTISSILPYNRINKKAMWDFPSIAVLSRTFLETSHRYFYLAEDDISEEEKEFRLKLYYYHLNSEKYKLYKGIDPHNEMLKEFEAKQPIFKKELLASNTFKKLSKYKANKIKRGYMDMHFTDKEMAERFSLLENDYKFFYRLLSNHSHGSPFATSSQSNIRGRGIKNEDEVFYMNMILLLLNHYLSFIIIKQVNLLDLQSKNPKELKFAQSVFKNS